MNEKTDYNNICGSDDIKVSKKFLEQLIIKKKAMEIAINELENICDDAVEYKPSIDKKKIYNEIKLKIEAILQTL